MTMNERKNPLDRHSFYKPCRKLILRECGILKGCRIWEEAGEELRRMTDQNPKLEEHNGAMVVPAAALYKTLEANGQDAERIMNSFGDQMGERFAKIVHGITVIPGADKLIWNNVDRIMHFMSGPDFGYERRIVSEPPKMFGVDILSCPYHRPDSPLRGRYL